MGYIGRKRKWKSGNRPSEPANPSGQSSPQPGPSGEPAALRDDQPGASSKRSRPGAASPRPRAATAPRPPQPGASTALGARGDNGGSSSSMSSRPGAASPRPRAATAPRSPQPVASRQVFESMEMPGAGPAYAYGYPPHAPPQVFEPNGMPGAGPAYGYGYPPQAAPQVFEPMGMPGAGPAYGNGYPPHAAPQVSGLGAGPAYGYGYPPRVPPQVFGLDRINPVVATILASLPRSAADMMAKFCALLAFLVVCGDDDFNTIELLEQFMGQTNHELSTMVHSIMTHYNGGFPPGVYGPEMETEETRCPICLEDYKEGDGVSMFPCNHLMHNHCLQIWVERSRTCPVCRTPA
ncbi:basic proline-rich protein-like [Engraulis encrasicolus]|uniref:basic proline-rich protein-like n=1 Tax=Engraulis encrasicolus TaxID=184585 RepID=UPI002FD15D5E